jgi:hypothetical protein
LKDDRVSKYSPVVTTALNNPLATLSISSSICCSVEEGELRVVYVETGPEKVDWVGDVRSGGGGGGGRREKRAGDGAINDRYWSTT